MQIDLAEIIDTTEFILSQKPDPVVEFLLCRDILKKSTKSLELVNLRKALPKNRWIKLLTKEQQDDGSWGPLHSQDSRSNRKIITTEYGVAKAIALGLDHSDDILKHASKNLEEIIKTGKSQDRAEKNERWSIGLSLFASSTLAQILPDHPLVNTQRELWRKIINNTFKLGKYDPIAEKKSHKESNGITGDLKHLHLNSKYHIGLIGSKQNFLSHNIENAYLDWIFNKMGKISYIDFPLNVPIETYVTKHMELWMRSIETMSNYTTWVVYALNALKWLWDSRDKHGCWNFGSKAKSSHSIFPISNNWYSNRSLHDWTTKLLII
ncbi:MAG: hypothetical protein ACXAD7_19160 [Candidatus Kariarchaeaceae archaeon]|jgi:hypothetical protein